MRSLMMFAVLSGLGAASAMAVAADTPPAPRPAERQPGSPDPRYTCDLGRVGVYVISARESARPMKLQAAAVTPPVRGIC